MNIHKYNSLTKTGEKSMKEEKKIPIKEVKEKLEKIKMFANAMFISMGGTREDQAGGRELKDIRKVSNEVQQILVGPGERK